MFSKICQGPQPDFRKYNFYFVIEVPDHVCFRLDLYMSHVQNITDTHNTNTCDMYKSSLRHIHDPVLLSQDRNYTCNFFFCYFQTSCMSLVQCLTHLQRTFQSVLSHVFCSRFIFDIVIGHFCNVKRYCATTLTHNTRAVNRGPSTRAK